MRLCSFVAGLTVVFGTASMASAQVVPQPQVPTTVQLPTFSVFTVQTTVSVPDSGGALLGGINRGASGSTSRGLGPLKNRALGSSRVASGVSVSASIIDQDEIDRAVLAAAAKRGQAVDPAAMKAADLSKSIARSQQRMALPDSVAAIREQNRVAAEERGQELADYFAKARKAEADGNIAVAKVFYQMVARRDTGPLKQQSEARLAALNSDQSTGVANR
jgi:hypothetical protein